MSMIGYTVSMADVLNELREAMKRDGRSLNQLARDSDVDVSALSRFQTGERGLGVESAARLAAALGMELNLKPAARKRRES